MLGRGFQLLVLRGFHLALVMTLLRVFDLSSLLPLLDRAPSLSSNFNLPVRVRPDIGPIWLAVLVDGVEASLCEGRGGDADRLERAGVPEDASLSADRLFDHPSEREEGEGVRSCVGYGSAADI